MAIIRILQLILLIWKDANSISCKCSQAFDGFLDGPGEE